MTTDLVVREPLDVSKVFTPEGMSGILQDIETQAMAHVPDIETDQGRKDIASLAYQVARSKTLIDTAGKESVAHHKKEVDKVNKLRKQARDFLDELKNNVRKPLTDYEIEQERIKAEEEARKKAEIELRIKLLMEVNHVMSFHDVAILTDDEFNEILSTKRDEYEKEQAIIIAEKEAEEKRNAEEAEKQRLENERLDKIRKEQEAEAERLKKQAEELAAKEKAIQDEKDRTEREEAEKKAAEEAKIKAEQEAKAKAEREEDEKRWRERLDFLYDCGWNGQEAFDIETEETIFSHKELVKLSDTDFYKRADAYNVMIENRNKQAAEEEEKRKAALIPDVDKLKDWLDRVENTFDESPDMSTEDGEGIKKAIVNFFDEFISEARGYL